MAFIRKINFSDACDDIDALVDTFDFTLTGKTESIGKDLADAACESMRYRALEEKDPLHRKWKDNEKNYAKYKEVRYDVHEVGILSGQMLSQESMNGQRFVTPNSVQIIYGTGRSHQGPARNGAPMKPHELIPTDREKADWFTKGGRRFFEFDAEDAEAVFDEAKDAWTEHMKNRGFRDAGI